MRSLRRLFLGFALTAALVISPGLAAAPAGAEYGPLAVYQVAFSFNCNNPAFCGSELGGFWGWAVFNSDGTSDAQLTGCGHLQGGPGGGGGGAQHFSADATGWFIAPSSENPSMLTFWISHEVVTFTGHGPPVTLTDPEPPYPADTGIPAVPGHYNTSELLGFSPPPGVSFMVQVVRIPNR
jgi:hypothetical protein